MHANPPKTLHSSEHVAFSRTYAAAVMLVAVFLIAITLFRTPVKGYVAQASVRANETAAPQNIARIAAWLESEPVLAAALREIPAAKDASIAELQQNLDVRTPTSTSATAFQIRLNAESPALAAAIVNELCGQFTSKYLRQERDAAETAELSRLRGRVRAVRSEEDRLRAGLERLRQEQLSRVIASARVPAPEANNNPIATVESSHDDSQRQQIVERIKSLQVQRTVLLGDRTSEHPQVVALDNQLARLQEEVTALATAGIEPPRNENSAALDIAPREPGLTDLPRQMIDPAAPTDAIINVAARIEEAAHQLSQVTWDRQQAEHDLESAAANAATPASVVGWTAEPASIIGRIGGTPSPLQMLLAGLLAFVAAAAMYRATAKAQQSPPLQTVEEVRQSLELPLVAELAVSIDTAARRPRMNHKRTVRLVTHLAEAALVALAVVCLLSAVADRSLAGEMATDPLGAMSVIVDRVGRLL